MSVYYRERPEFLRSALQSVFEQTLPPTEVMLVEDGPLTPALDRVVAEFTATHAELKTIRLPKNAGLGNALNEGLKHCSHELVARMDSDDICKPFRFERQLQFFDEHPETDICSAWIDEFENDKDHVISRRCLPERHEDIMHYAKTRCPMNHVTVVYRKSKVLELGGYHGFPEDYFLWVRMLMSGCRFHNIQESLVWMRFDADVVKRRGGWKYAKDDMHMQWKFYKTGFLTLPELIKNVMVRLTVRLMPNRLRVWVYGHLLRNSVTDAQA